MDGRSHDWSLAKRRARRQVPLTEFYLGQPPNLPKVTRTLSITPEHWPTVLRTRPNLPAHSPTLPNTDRPHYEHDRTDPNTPEHSRTPMNTTNTTNRHPRALPNVTEHITRVTNFCQGVQTQPSRQTDRPTYLKTRPYGYRRGRGLEGEALPRYRWERLSLSRTLTKTPTYLRTYDPDGEPTHPGQGAGHNNTLCTHDDQLWKIYVYTEFQKRLVNYDAPARWPVYDRSDRQACAHTREQHRRFSHITDTNTRSHPFHLFTHTDTGTFNLL